MAHYMLNLRPIHYFQLAPNMRVARIELCIYVISKSVYDRPDDRKKSREANGTTGFPGPRAKYYIPLVVGQRSMGLQEYSSRSKVVHLVVRSYCLYGSTVVRKHGSSVRGGGN